jgi:hypothetical protein
VRLRGSRLEPKALEAEAEAGGGRVTHAIAQREGAALRSLSLLRPLPLSSALARARATLYHHRIIARPCSPGRRRATRMTQLSKRCFYFRALALASGAGGSPLRA